MLWLSAILAADATCLWAQANTSAASCCRIQSAATDTEVVLACSGIEFLGQATAAFFALQQRQANDSADITPSAGMLVSSRRYDATRACWPPTAELLIRVELQSGTPTPGGLVKFAGCICLLQPTMARSASDGIGTDPLAFDPANLAAWAGEPLAEGDLSVFIPPPETRTDG